MIRRTLQIALLLASLSFAAPLFAQNIVTLNQEGVTAYSEGRFADAAQKFGQAYDIKPEPPLKKNEAVAWFKAERCSEALAAAKEYLALGIDNPLSTQEAQTVVVRCYIQRAEADLTAGNDASALTALADARASSPTEEDGQTIARLETDIQTRRDAAAAEQRLATEAARQEEERRKLEQERTQGRILGLAVAGTGGAIVLGTLIYHIALATGTASKFRDASETGDRATYDKLGKRLETGNWLVPTLYAVGLATSGLGVYLWWRTAPESPSATGALHGLETLGATATWSF